MPRWCRGGPVAPAWFPEAGGRRRRLAGTAVGPGTSTGNGPGQSRTAGGRGCTRAHQRPQGGGTSPGDERAVFTAVVYVPTTGCAWRHLPPTFGTSFATASPLHDMDRGRPMASAPPDELGARGEVDWTSAIVDTAVRTRSIAAGQAASRTSCPMPRASHSASPCPARTCSTASPASRSSSASPPSGPAEATETPPRQTPRGQAVLFHRTPGLTARAWDRRAHRAARHRLRRTPRPAPLEGRALRERNGCR